MDVIAAAHRENKVRWFSNNGNADPSFSSTDINTGSDARSVHAADLNGNGHIDVVVADKDNNRVMWLENNGSQSFVQIIIKGNAWNARSVYAVDLDRDGDIDVISASESDDEISPKRSDSSFVALALL